MFWQKIELLPDLIFRMSPVMDELSLRQPLGNSNMTHSLLWRKFHGDLILWNSEMIHEQREHINLNPM